MICNFGDNNCSPECPKFSICMYNSIQTQLSEINGQLSFILQTLTHLTCEEGIINERVSLVEKNINDIVSTLIDMTNDSETKQKKNKES